MIHADTSAVSVVIDRSANEERDRLLHGAKLIERVDDAIEQESAVSLGRDIKKLLADVEASRKAVKAPVIELGKTIDETAKSFVAPLQSAVDEVARLCTSFQIMERLRVIRAEAVRADTVALAEAERLAKLDEAKAAAKSMQDEAGLAKAIEAEAAAKAADEAARAVIVAPLPEVAKAAGMRGRRVPTVTVLDLHQVYAHDRSLVRLELNRAAFNTKVVEGITVPGLEIRWEDQTSFQKA